MNPVRSGFNGRADAAKPVRADSIVAVRTGLNSASEVAQFAGFHITANAGQTPLYLGGVLEFLNNFEGCHLFSLLPPVDTFPSTWWLRLPRRYLVSPSPLPLKVGTQTQPVMYRICGWGG